MAIELKWNPEDVEDAEEEYSEKVAENLKKKLEKREDETQYYTSLESYRGRFHNSFRLTDDLMVYEIRFSAESKEWRGICIEVESREKVYYFDICSKNNQEQFLDYMKKNSAIISEEIKSRS